VSLLSTSFGKGEKDAPERWTQERVASIERERILREANKVLDLPPVCITEFRAALSAGGIHDYYSNGDYWWPDPSKPDGLPYIQRDGETNPRNFDHHRLVLRELRDRVAALCAAYRITGEERYAATAVRLLRCFFIDPKTRMNPNLSYAQAIPGVCEGRGIGIIDTLHLIEVPVAIESLLGSASFTAEELAALKQWFGDYVNWMIGSPNGLEEGSTKNNHSVAYWLQVAVFSQFTGNKKLLDESRREFKEVFVPGQMALDGSFPAEMKRTKPYAYSIFQLDNMTTLCQVLSSPDENLWDFYLPVGRGIARAVAFLEPFLANKLSWPLKPDVQAWNGWPSRQPFLLFAGMALHQPSYLNLWEKLPPDPENQEVRRNIAITQPLLWLK
jgi:hypothetical protein